VREGPQGARGLNARIEELLASRAANAGTRRAAAIGPAGNRYFHGRLLLVTENSYRHRLFNGDIGLCLEGDDGTPMAWFPGVDAHSPRPFHPAALPAHESAFAMTVHKAQGSEFDEVWLILPARFNRVLSRELVYTGITRARSRLHLAGSEAVLREALSSMRAGGRDWGGGWAAIPAAPSRHRFPKARTKPCSARRMRLSRRAASAHRKQSPPWTRASVHRVPRKRSHRCGRQRCGRAWNIAGKAAWQAKAPQADKLRYGSRQMAGSRGRSRTPIRSRSSPFERRGRRD
jgi:hypothetical protein